MADIRLWNRETIKDLIEIYKAHPCLWKVSCESYSNKHSKAIAYKQLVQFCKKRGFPDATRDFVFRKIQSLRGSFRKELRKTLDYQSKGKSYQSSLWYFNNLLFTKGQESSLPAQNESGSEEETQTDHYEDEEIEEAKFEVNEEEDSLNCHSDSPSPPTSPPPKRMKNTEQPQLEFCDLGQDKPRKEPSEFELAGMNIAKKLARMDETQAIYAESIINAVIRKGLLRKLTEDTDLCDNLCGRRILTVSHLPQPSSQT